jgi:2-haloacid dehalogenase
MPDLTPAVVFDAYGTLFDVHSVVVECEWRFPGQGAEFSRRWRARQIEYTWLRSLMGRHEDFEAVTRSAAKAAAASLDLNLPPEVLQQLMQAYDRLTPFSDVPQTLAGLRDYRCAILSNGSRRMLAAAVANAGMTQHFDRLISVDEIGIFKPHPSVYGLVCKQWKIEPDEVAFVSSNFWDVAGATSFGFRTFWINRAKAKPEELGLEPVAVLGSLNELLPALARLSHP